MVGRCPNDECTVVVYGGPSDVCPACGTPLVPLWPDTKPEPIADPLPSSVLIKALYDLIDERVAKALLDDTDPRAELAALESRLAELEIRFEGHTHQLAIDDYWETGEPE